MKLKKLKDYVSEIIVNFHKGGYSDYLRSSKKEWGKRVVSVIDSLQFDVVVVIPYGDAKTKEQVKRDVTDSLSELDFPFKVIVFTDTSVSDSYYFISNNYASLFDGLFIKQVRTVSDNVMPILQRVMEKKNQVIAGQLK